MNFNQVKHFYSDQGMIENSYLKSHIFYKEKLVFFYNSDENSNEDIIILLFFKY